VHRRPLIIIEEGPISDDCVVNCVRVSRIRKGGRRVVASLPCEVAALRRGVMVVFGAAVRFCYRVWCVAFSTRVLLQEKGRIVELIAFIFCSRVAGYTCCRLNVFRREGGSPSTTATVMVGVFGVGISTAARVDACTAVEVLLKIILFPNYGSLGQFVLFAGW